jgi:hypothetical protein
MEWSGTALMNYGGGCGGGKMWSKADLWRKPERERLRVRTERENEEKRRDVEEERTGRKDRFFDRL